MALPPRTPKPPAAAALYAPWMARALQYIGTHEIVKGLLNPIVREFFSHTRFPADQVTSKTAWCAAYASTVLDLSSLKAARTARARDFLSYGVALKRPVYGALLVFSRGSNGPDDPRAHVAFCVSEKFEDGDPEVLALGGNQNNMVCVQPKKTDTLLGVRWPPDVPLPPTAERLEEGVS